MDAKDAKDTKETQDVKVNSISDTKDDASISSRILAAASVRNRLIQQIADTQHAKSTLSELALQITDLSNKGFDASQLVSTLNTNLREQRATLDKHQKQAESSLGKLFHRHSTDKKVLEAEEDAYFEASNWASKAQVKLDRIDTDLAELKKQRADLRSQQDQNTAALIALDELYNSVFDGPSPGLAEEDALEAAVKVSQSIYDAIQTRLTHALAVLGRLNVARASVTAALGYISTALKYSRQDIVDFNGVHSSSATTAANLLEMDRRHFSSARADRIERHNLAKVPGLLAEAEHNLALAKQMDPEHLSVLIFLPKVSVAGQGHSVANILDQAVNTPLTDYLFHMEIQDTQEAVQGCLDVLNPEADKAQARADAIREECVPAEEALNDGRQQLMAFRVELFEKTLREKDGQKEVGPPAYDGGLEEKNS